MLALGMLMNGFTVQHIIGQFRAGKPDGAVILAVLDADDGYEFVVARVSQRQVESPDPATHWDNGDYTRVHPDDLEDQGAKVMRDLLERADVMAVADLVPRS